MVFFFFSWVKIWYQPLIYVLSGYRRRYTCTCLYIFIVVADSKCKYLIDSISNF